MMEPNTNLVTCMYVKTELTIEFLQCYTIYVREARQIQQWSIIKYFPTSSYAQYKQQKHILFDKFTGP